jgi:hypothetical protein
VKRDMDSVCHHLEYDDTVNAYVRENRRFTTDELHKGFPHVWRSVLYEIVTVQI